ncbi:hypothetical protein ACJ41O_006278 [Fusarium nematophilum]
MSLSEKECWRDLGCSRKDAFRRFTSGLRAALLDTRFLTSQNLTSLQALTLYVMSIQEQSDPGTIWILSGVCVRMAEKMGLHKDSELLGLAPFETEMRRRLWWQIVMLDIRATRASGLGTSLLPRRINCKMPTNLDDADLQPGATQPFQNSNRPTEMIICLLSCKIGLILSGDRDLQEAAASGDGNILVSVSHGRRQVDGLKKLAQEVEDGLDSIMSQFSDPSAGPIHHLAVHLRNWINQSLRDILRPPAEEPEWGSEILNCSDNLFKFSIVTVERFMCLQQALENKRFLWSMVWSFHQDIFAHMVSQLCHRTSGSLVERAWMLVPAVYECHGDLHDVSWRSNRRIAKFTLKAWGLRYNTLRFRLGRHPDVPDYVRRLEFMVKPKWHENHGRLLCDMDVKI